MTKRESMGCTRQPGESVQLGPRAEYTGRAMLTLADERAGYPESRQRIMGYSFADLEREYHDLHRACFGLFGRNAREHFNLIVDELLARGITELPNIFGNIPVRHEDD